ncbi:hypothetical protein PLESTB_000599100 [Pleodorina starrii]|uniref:Ankyrin repeat domain-containing protein n=1 Tax=Pleodorina starrii TaxID=330485 RepID=A0A9W6BIJ5_9CHLO|nr:hypothetical protein PLESTM_001847600 [Pleodorina starrii]GLC52237.1 hypothetical protein PLESTB_000599100 [Pleodorina starrii]GLC67582.1 hypothetical protein PLESTF_000576600 [Pleodorina starrii]
MATSTDASRVWLPGIVQRIAGFMSPNEVACTLRLVDKASAQQFSRFQVVRLSLASPSHAFRHRWGAANAYRQLSRLKRLKLLQLTAASGNLENLELALASAGLLVTPEVLEAAAAAGQLHVCQLLRERYVCPWGNSLAAAARGGHWHICEWLLASGCGHDPAAPNAAARAGHISLALWLLLLELPLSGGDSRGGGSGGGGGGSDGGSGGGGGGSDGGSGGGGGSSADVGMSHLGSFLASAASGCSLDVLQQTHDQLARRLRWPTAVSGSDQEQQLEHQQQRRQGDANGGAGQLLLDQATFAASGYGGEILAAAAGSPTPDWQSKVEWLETALGCPRTHEACVEAARGPDALERLQWLALRRGYPTSDPRVTEVAAKSGSLAALRFLVEERGARPGLEAASMAAFHGQLAVLQYLHIRNCPLDLRTALFSASCQGHVAVAVWAVEQLGGEGAAAARRWSDWVAVGDSVEMLARLQERGWVPGGGAFVEGAEGGCEAVLEWLVEHGCPMPVDGRPYLCSARNGDLAMLRCLHRLGCPWGRQMLLSCVSRGCPLPTLRLLRELGCPAPADWSDVVRAAASVPVVADHLAQLQNVLMRRDETQRRPGAAEDK